MENRQAGDDDGKEHNCKRLGGNDEYYETQSNICDFYDLSNNIYF